MKLPQSFTTITTFSKTLAGVLSIVLPVAGFLLGIQYQKLQTALELLPMQQPTYSPTPTQDEISDWKTYRNEEYGFEFKFPETCKVLPADRESGWPNAILLLYCGGQSKGGKDYELAIEIWNSEDEYKSKYKTFEYYLEGITVKNKGGKIFTLLNVNQSSKIDQILSTFEFVGSSQTIENNAETVTINFDVCSPQTHRIDAGFGSTTIEVIGKDGQMCSINYGGEVENPNWDGKLTNKCQVPTSLQTMTFDISNFGVDLSAIYKYCEGSN